MKPPGRSRGECHADDRAGPPGYAASEIAIEEYRALRQETVSHFTSMTTLVSIALTATAAIAGFAFGSKPEDGYRLEILLALPLVLSGLGLANLVHTSSVLNIGYYTKT